MTGRLGCLPEVIRGFTLTALTESEIHVMTSRHHTLWKDKEYAKLLVFYSCVYKEGVHFFLEL